MFGSAYLHLWVVSSRYCSSPTALLNFIEISTSTEWHDRIAACYQLSFTCNSNAIKILNFETFRKGMTEFIIPVLQEKVHFDIVVPCWQGYSYCYNSLLTHLHVFTVRGLHPGVRGIHFDFLVLLGVLASQQSGILKIPSNRAGKCDVTLLSNQKLVLNARLSSS